MKPLIALAFFLALFVPGFAQCSKSDCLSYGPAITEIKGRITRKPFFGPPNFGEDPKHDSKETALILHLVQPICVTNGARLENSDEFDVKEIQLSLIDPAWKQFKAIKRHIGTKRTFIVRGELFHAHTGHHVTLVLMLVKSIALSAP